MVAIIITLLWGVFVLFAVTYADRKRLRGLTARAAAYDVQVRERLNNTTKSLIMENPELIDRVDEMGLNHIGEAFSMPRMEESIIGGHEDNHSYRYRLKAHVLWLTGENLKDVEAESLAWVERWTRA